MQTKTVKYGKIEVPIQDGKSLYIPQNGGKFIDHGEILKTIAIGIRDNLPVLIMGESGTGKTSAIRFVASQTKQGLRRVNLNGGTTADELVGRLLINDKGTYWVDGILTEAMRNGEILVLDEINAALPEVLFVLQSILDDDGYLVLNEKDNKEIVYKHPNFRLFATCNPPEYAGTKEMNKALLSRFAICINTEFPPEKTELEIIEHHLGNAISKSELAIKLVSLANQTREAKELGTSEYEINTRDILNTLRLAQNMEPTEALGLAFANKLDKEDNKAIKTIAKLHLPTKKQANNIRTQINDIKDLHINNTYIMEKDINNAYYSLTDNKAKYQEIITKKIGDIISENQKETAIKGDEFKITGIYYEEEEEIFTTEATGKGNNIGSTIEITAGPNKGKKGIIIHSKEIDKIMNTKTAQIINDISQITQTNTTL